MQTYQLLPLHSILFIPVEEKNKTAEISRTDNWLGAMSAAQGIKMFEKISESALRPTKSQEKWFLLEYIEFSADSLLEVCSLKLWWFLSQIQAFILQNFFLHHINFFSP